MDWRVDFLPCKAKIRRYPDGWQGFLTQSGRKIRRQDMRREILNRLSDTAPSQARLDAPAENCRGGQQQEVGKSVAKENPRHKAAEIAALIPCAKLHHAVCN
jgi:hypothetical protein